MTATSDTAPVPGPGGFATVVRPAPGTGSGLPVPRRSAGLRLHGEYQGSGFTEPQYIARRGDGQVVQLSRLLYLVTEAVDGVRDTERISHLVSGLSGREVSPENVAYLIERKLTPLGVTVPWDQEDDEAGDAPRSDLLLALTGHRVLLGERRVNRIGRGLAWLHRPPVVLLVLAAGLAMDVWLFAFHGAMGPVLGVLDQPVLLLAVFALTVASLVFHEFGHASACRYGGARPGCIGCGLFLLWPSLYTDVTDVYRIGRAGRIRTDLGGIYFNVVFMLGLAGCYLLSGQPLFLSAVYLGHFEVLEQLMPAVRLDGYYILGDLAGIPDLYGKIRPILLGMIPGRATPPEAAALKRSARVIVTLWVVGMVPLLAADLGYALWNLPRILATGVRSLTEQLAGTGAAFAHGQPASGAVGLIGCLMLICPLAGMSYLSFRLVVRLLRAARRATAGSPRLRTALSATAVLALGGLCWAWAAGITPKPLPAQPPLVPALQPGVPTAPPSPTRPPVARPAPPRSDADHDEPDADDLPGGPGTAPDPRRNQPRPPGAPASPTPQGPAAPDAPASSSAPATRRSGTPLPSPTAGPSASTTTGGPAVSPTPQPSATPTGPTGSATPAPSGSGTPTSPSPSASRSGPGTAPSSRPASAGPSQQPSPPLHPTPSS